MASIQNPCRFIKIHMIKIVQFIKKKLCKFVHKPEGVYTEGGYLYFYNPKFNILDPFAPTQIKLWGKDFPTAEHAYQYKKFETGAPSVADEILRCKNPWQIRSVVSKNKSKMDPNFDKVKVMTEVFRTKMLQHKEVQEILVQFEEYKLLENSATDTFWGIGQKHNGKNMTGKIWMILRDEL